MRKDKIRILHIAQAAGGVDRYIRMLLKYLDKEKFENILVCSQDFREEDYKNLVDFFEQVKMDTIPKNERRLKSVEEHLKMLEQEEQKYQTLRRQLYEDMSSGIVNKEEYKEFSHSFNEKVETIRKAKAEMNRQRDCLNNLDVEHLPFIMWRLSFLTMKKHEISM